MDTLPNVNTRRGENEFSYAGFVSNVSPEVQNLQVENSHAGGTSNFVSKANYYWFVFRVLYGHMDNVIDALENKGIKMYIPMHYDMIEMSGKKKLRKDLFFPVLFLFI